jgi:hypothetical protein
MLFPENFKAHPKPKPSWASCNKLTAPSFLTVNIETGEITVDRVDEVLGPLPCENSMLLKRGRRIENRMPTGPIPAEP